MKKITRTFVSLMAITLLVITAACSGSDDSDSTNGNGNGDNDILVGKWKYIGWYDAFLDEFEDDQDDCYDEIWTFKSDGTGTFLEEDCEDVDLTTAFNWEKVGDNQYELSGNGETYPIMTSFEGNNRLTILEDEEGSGDVFVRQ
jgi:hypothetical protein